MSTFSEREAILRTALHSAADAIEPANDGLERIRARLRSPRPLPVAWAEAAWTDLLLRAPAGVHTAVDRVAAAVRLAWDRFGPTSGAAGGRGSRPLSWLRPLTAMGVAIFIVAAGAYAAISAQQAIFPSSSNSPPTHGGGSGPNGSNPGGPGTASSQSGGLLPLGGLNPSASASASACKSPRPKASGTGSPAPSIQPITPTPTPSGSSTQSGSPSPSPSGSDTSTPNPSSSATGSSVGGAPAVTSATLESGEAATNTALISKNPKAKASPSPTPCATKVTTQHFPVKAQPGVSISPSVGVSPSVVSAVKMNDFGGF